MARATATPTTTQRPRRRCRACPRAWSGVAISIPGLDRPVAWLCAASFPVNFYVFPAIVTPRQRPPGERIVKSSCLFPVLLLVAVGLSARADGPEDLRLVSNPTLSPDGSTLAFVWGGDIWAVPAEGGNARPL